MSLAPSRASDPQHPPAPCGFCGGGGWVRTFEDPDGHPGLLILARCGRCVEKRGPKHQLFPSDAAAARHVVTAALMFDTLRRDRGTTPAERIASARLHVAAPRLLKAAIAARAKLNVLNKLAGEEDPDWRELDAAIRLAADVKEGE